MPVRILITGASSGIGEATAYRFAREGARLGLLARREERLREVATRARELGGDALVLVADVTSRDAVTAAVARAEAAFEGLDVLVNNAGQGIYAYLETVREEDLKHVFAVNTFGALYAIQAVLPGMKRRQSGVIVNVSSIVGKRALPMTGAYGAAKFALHGLSDALRLELRGTGVHVSVVCPGYTKTEFAESTISYGFERRKPRRNAMSAAEVADAIWRSAKNPRREVVLSSAGKFIVQLNRFFPAAADWVLARYMRLPE
ncbi:MAG: SDR family oxidoreductase [Vicinamibacteria bacterium]